MTARNQASRKIAFACGSCGLRKTVHLPADAEPSRDDELLARVPCPSCGYVEHRFFVIRSAKLVILGILVAIVGLVKALTDDAAWMLLALAGVAATLALFVRGMHESSLAREAIALALSDDPIAATQLAGTTCAVCAKRIVTDDDGSSCPDCAKSLHRRKCAAQHAASVHAGAGAVYRTMK